MQTSYQHKTGKSGPQAYDINSRAALACLHTGVGQTHLDGILATMNVPTMSRASFKTREREAGTAVESIAKVTCQQIITSEKVHAVSTGATPDENYLNLFLALMIWGGRNVVRDIIPILVKVQ